MSLSHCMDIVSRHDPERFLVLRGFPEAVRERLVPLYALNLEISRAAWVSREPLVCEMRLQWWSDLLDRMAAGEEVRGQPVAEACGFLRGEAALCARLQQIIEARGRDVWPEPFEDNLSLFAYLEATGGVLTEVAAELLSPGSSESGVLRRFGTGAALARWLIAVPELEARGRWPLPEGSPEAIRDLAGQGLQRMAEARRARTQCPKAVLPALLSDWQASSLLKLAQREPGRVASGHLLLPDYKKRGLLAWRALTGRW